MTTDAAEKLVDLLIEKAPALREAGVLTLTLGEMTVQMAPHYTDPGEVGGTGDFVGNPHSDPVMDPSAYQGGFVPGFPKPPEGYR